MACFVVPVAEAIVTTIVEKALKAKELKTADGVREEVSGIPFSRKLSWLNKMLWGGSFLLAFEHVWHGEVVPWFPFLTAMSNPEDAAEMYHEMLTVGVSMAALVTFVWCVMLVVSAIMEKKAVLTGSRKGVSQA